MPKLKTNMILIQSSKSEYTTDDVIDWLYYLSSDIELKRINDFQEISNIHYCINNTEERILLKTNDEEIDSSSIESFWYRRGTFSFDSFINNSLYSKLGLNGKRYIESELKYLGEAIDESLALKANSINP